jgi:hypothetical protein
MNAFPTKWVGLGLLVLTGIGSPALFAQETSPERDAFLEQQATLRAIEADRATVIAAIVDTWQFDPVAEDNPEHWLSEFEAALSQATAQQLLDIQAAQSYSEVQQILLFGSASASTELLGETTRDLVFTPVPPCRFYDSRFGSGSYTGPYGPNVTRSYQVYGSGATIGAQGGNSAGCAAPAGEPAGIAANFTVVPNQGFSGHITPYPFGAPLPQASFVNYYPNVNIANAGLLATCFLCSFDLNVYHFSRTHSLGDVMGFYYPARSAASYNAGLVTNNPLLNDGIFRFIGPTTQLTLTDSGQKVHWVATQALGATAGASSLDLYPCYRLASSSSNPIAVGGGMWGHSVAGLQRLSFSVSAEQTNLTPATYQFGMCYVTSSSGWNNNEWGYVSATIVP